MFSTVPGFESPNAALRSEKDKYVSAKATEIALLYKKPKGDSFSSRTGELVSSVIEDIIVIFELT